MAMIRPSSIPSSVRFASWSNAAVWAVGVTGLADGGTSGKITNCTVPSGTTTPGRVRWPMFRSVRPLGMVAVSIVTEYLPAAGTLTIHCPVLPLTAVPITLAPCFTVNLTPGMGL